MDINEKIESNMGLVYHQLNKFRLLNDPEALSIATEALWNAIVTYKTGTAAKFSTYASVCIYNALGCYVRHLKRKRQLDIFSYDIPITDDATLEVFMTDSYSAEDMYLQSEFAQYSKQAIEKVVNSFQAGTSQLIVRYWIDSYCTAKQRELSDKFGISQSYISRVLSMAKYRLKKELEEYTCEK